MEPAQEEVQSLAAVTTGGLRDCRSWWAVSLLPQAGLYSFPGWILRAQGPANWPRRDPGHPHHCPAVPTGAGLSLGALEWSTPWLPSLGIPEASNKAKR